MSKKIKASVNQHKQTMRKMVLMIARKDGRSILISKYKIMYRSRIPMTAYHFPWSKLSKMIPFRIKMISNWNMQTTLCRI